MLTVELVPRHIQKQFTVAELFVFASINAFFLYFEFDSIEKKDAINMYLPGCNISNILIFTPWLALNLMGLIQCLLSVTGLQMTVKSSLLTFVTGMGLTFVTVSPFNDFEMLKEFIKIVIVPDLALIFYMLLMLSFGLIGIINIA